MLLFVLQGPVRSVAGGSMSDLVALGEDAEGVDYYQDEVNIDDLGSVSGVSLASFIDWDQVDELTGIM